MLQIHSPETNPDPKQYKIDSVYIRMAQIWAENSHCRRSQVGCIIVKDRMIISDGYNGTPSGFPNRCEDENNKTLDLVLHAEANAITKIARSTMNSEGSTLYVTLSPCFGCAKLIIQAGIKRIVFLDLYSNTDSFEMFDKAGIEIVQIRF